MKNIKKFLLPLLLAFTVVSAHAQIVVKNVTATPRWPWNGMVDVESCDLLRCQISAIVSPLATQLSWSHFTEVLPEKKLLQILSTFSSPVSGLDFRKRNDCAIIFPLFQS